MGIEKSYSQNDGEQGEKFSVHPWKELRLALTFWFGTSPGAIYDENPISFKFSPSNLKSKPSLLPYPIPQAVLGHLQYEIISQNLSAHRINPTAVVEVDVVACPTDGKELRV